MFKLWLKKSDSDPTWPSGGTRPSQVQSFGMPRKKNISSCVGAKKEEQRWVGWAKTECNEKKKRRKKEEEDEKRTKVGSMG